jgi:hypothetical protein
MVPDRTSLAGEVPGFLVVRTLRTSNSTLSEPGAKETCLDARFIVRPQMAFCAETLALILFRAFGIVFGRSWDVDKKDASLSFTP